uniref:Uncharacterized protein AlNc14C263G9849 n=1 Tax=Albugo laibachii Nc14 TaxID=890382 RepID=F0WU26_9STRA|nr:conserved hypothetical protein [Albugo laibachii Nc14]CCA24955.1 conserved hypothetical protein [Albugo laibachii Nc14]|eukprot:CCA24955.1 conserved hypothetical protein [Albugo laibachii Nc14]
MQRSMGIFEDDFSDLDVNNFLDDKSILSSNNKLSYKVQKKGDTRINRINTNDDSSPGYNIGKLGLSEGAGCDDSIRKEHLSTNKSRRKQNETLVDQMTKILDLDQHRDLSQSVQTFVGTRKKEKNITEAVVVQEKLVLKEDDSISASKETDRFTSVASFFDQDDIQIENKSALGIEPMPRTSRQARRGFTSVTAKNSAGEMASSSKQLHNGNSDSKRFEDPFNKSSRFIVDTALDEKKHQEVHARSSRDVREKELTKAELSSRSHGAPSALECLLFDLPPSPGLKDKERIKSMSGDNQSSSDVSSTRTFTTDALIDSLIPTAKSNASAGTDVGVKAQNDDQFSVCLSEREERMSKPGASGTRKCNGEQMEVVREVQITSTSTLSRDVLDTPESPVVHKSLRSAIEKSTTEIIDVLPTKIDVASEIGIRSTAEKAVKPTMTSEAHTTSCSQDRLLDSRKNNLSASGQDGLRTEGMEEVEALKLSVLNVEAEKEAYKTKVGKLMLKKHSIKIENTSLKQQLKTMEEHCQKTTSASHLLRQQNQSLEQELSATKCLLNQEKQMHHSTQTQLKHAEQQLEAKTASSFQGLEKVGREVQQALTTFRANFERIEGDTQTRHRVEDETRLRMITAMDASSQNYSRQIQTECTRLSTLSNKLEALIGHFSLEHMENKERLRQEQSRMDLLTAHFKAQSTVLNEKSDASVQKLSEFLAVSLHNHRSAEARLYAQQTTLIEQERKIQDDRASFNTFREDFFKQHEREKQLLQVEKSSLEKSILQHHLERRTFEELIASHEAEFEHLQMCRQRISGEKNRLEETSVKIATMATTLEQHSSDIIAREEELLSQKQQAEKMHGECELRSKCLDQKEHQLTQREGRLQLQQNKLQKHQKNLLVQRHQTRELGRKETSRPTYDHNKEKISKEKISHIPALDLQRLFPDKLSQESRDLMEKNAFVDAVPSSLRKAMEDNWKCSRWKQRA